MNKRDYIYYDYRFDNIMPKNRLWNLYCKVRKALTICESPSKVCVWDMKRHFLGEISITNKGEEVC